MCFPPFCEPARRFLGNFSLRKGAAVVLVANLLYGLTLVVIHAILLGDMYEPGYTTGEVTHSSSAGGLRGAERRLSQPVDPYASRLGDPETTPAPPSNSGKQHRWMLQLLDLDIGWGHELLGFDDYSCLMSGLIYGVVIVLASAYMFHAVLFGGQNLPLTSRWFVAFLNLEIVLYIGLMLAKLPKLCRIQATHLPKLEMDCELLRFLYVERAAVGLILAGLGIWVFSSLAYFLAFGFQAIDRPEYAEHLEIHDFHHGDAGPGAYSTSNRQGPPMMSVKPPAQSMRSQHSSFAPQTQSFARHPHPGTQSAMAARGSTLAVPGPQRTSYNIPRASSSMVTTATSRSQAESHPLIKPPVAVF
eukprot:TRINITY_DN55438_c0_g1_i1.p1 TRINITY_DN55438_c0_g1~~TRINITY_DN55438_c0_g1_i1.p1  ORF type:complete len:359 (+),score=53.23 TRINITY_DN55438_c0_g1_i1:156-1232(+)